MSVLPFPVYVIHLPRSTKRKAHVEKELKRCGIENYSFVEGVDGHALSDEEIGEYKAAHAPLQPTEVGCYLSHVKVYEQMIRRQDEYALILEDDVCLCDDAVKVLAQHEKFPEDWMLMHIGQVRGAAHVLNRHTIRHLHGRYRVGLSMSYRVRAFAYLIHKRGVSFLLPKLLPITMPIDHLLFEYRVNHHFFHSIKPSLASQSSDFESTIQHRKKPIKDSLWNPRVLLGTVVNRAMWRFLSFFPPPKRRYVDRTLSFKSFYYVRMVYDYFKRKGWEKWA